MTKKYTQQDIDQFFEEFKNLPNSYEINKVHQLINNPYAKATHTIKFMSNHLKFIIMTSAFIVGVSALTLWLTSYKSNNISFQRADKTMISEYRLHNENTQKVENTSKQKKKKSKSLVQVYDNKIVLDTNLLKPKLNNDQIKDNDIQECEWSPDTIIDKNLLLLNLSDEEMKKIGIIRKGYASFYHNICPNGECDWHLGCHSKLIPENERIITHNEFYIRFVTNSNFEPDGGTDFYSFMDILVPVVTNNKAGQIFWFTPHDSLFAKLPIRYNYLKNTYDNLICLKEKFPNKTFTNFLSTSSESVLDAVNYLNLTKQELIDIGIIINKNTIVFQSKNNKYNLKITSKGTYSTGSDEDFKYFPPNPYPVVMTDTLGRRIFVQKSIIEKDSLSQIINILVPVRINLNEIIPSNQNVMICWYYPTQDFLDALPNEIGNELKSEVKIITNESQVSTSSCNYYEVCKSTLRIENFKLYPNPAKYLATIEFDALEELEGSISIVNIVGTRLKILAPNTTFLSGHNTYQLDLSGITPGIYLISINTNKGFKTQRIIISR